MQVRMYASVTLVMLLLLGCQPQLDLERERTQLLLTDKAFSQTSVEEGAAEAFNRYLHEEALQMPAGHYPIRGREAIYEQMKQDDTSYTLAWEPQDGDVGASSDLGWTWGTYTMSRVNESGDTLRSFGKYVNVWKRVDGEWKVLVDIGNKSPGP